MKENKKASCVLHRLVRIKKQQNKGKTNTKYMKKKNFLSDFLGDTLLSDNWKFQKIKILELQSVGHASDLFLQFINYLTHKYAYMKDEIKFLCKESNE